MARAGGSCVNVDIKGSVRIISNIVFSVYDYKRKFQHTSNMRSFTVFSAGIHLHAITACVKTEEHRVVLTWPSTSRNSCSATVRNAHLDGKLHHSFFFFMLLHGAVL